LDDDGSRHSAVAGETEDQEVLSLLKKPDGEAQNLKEEGLGTSRHQDMQVDETRHPRKRKSKVSNPATQTPDLNVPLEVSNAIVSAGFGALPSKLAGYQFEE
jgi:hypothetical protein